jgi:hypothetical protein
MLVTHQDGNFYKKATGKIVFTCNNGDEIKSAIKKSSETKEGQEVILVAEGVNSDGVVVSNFKFKWSLKVKE